MSGDQVLQNLSSKNNAEQFVTNNGLKIQSNLNPNALEFVPSYLQNNPQIKLKGELRTLILKKCLTENENQYKNSEKNEHFTNDVVEPIETKNNISVEAIEDDLKNEFQEDLNTGKNRLYMLFSSPSTVKHTSSESEISISHNNEPDNLPLDNKEENLVGHSDYCNIVEKTDKTTTEDKINTKVQDDLIIENSLLDINTPEINEEVNLISENIGEKFGGNGGDKDKSNKNLDNNKVKLMEKTEDKTDTELFSSKPKKSHLDEPKNQENLKKPNNSHINRNSPPGNQNKVQVNAKILKDLKDFKSKLNPNTKLASFEALKTGTVRKLNLSTKPKTEIKETNKFNTFVEAKKEIRPKTPTVVVQHKNTTKSFSTSSKSSNLYANNSSAVPLLKKDTISNRSTSSTEKSSSSNRSSTQSSIVKSTGPKTKEYVLKSPRATVASKLRKTETQKRRNLFFDIDTIKMSDFLFK